MKRNIITISLAAALCISNVYANDGDAQLYSELEVLKNKIQILEKKLEQKNVQSIDNQRIEKIEKKLNVVEKTAQKAKTLSSSDNIKWDIDFKTQVDNLQYKHTNGDRSKNNALLTNRLWLGAAYQPNDNTIFRGKLSYNKAFGDTANHSQSNTNPQFANFDWVTNENATNNTIKVKEAYWLYKNPNLFGADLPWTVSIGRRPSTDGLPINLRNDQKANSPLSHTVDVEFDGLSFKLDTEKTTGLTGSWFKICAGRGLTNAKPRFQMDGADYSKDETKNSDVDMLGFIATPYDDGQYSVHMNYARAWNMIGFDGASLMNFGQAYGAFKQDPNPKNAYNLQMAKPKFKDVGDMDFATVLLKSEGIGNGISDYLDDTTVFASYAVSKTRPNSLGMLGSTDSKKGHSIWLGLNAPCPISPDSARIGFEWNKGSKYWRSMTYGEDTYAGSKLATRGQAFEIYRTQKINNALSFGLSYLKIKYDYTGSNSFFGADGTPMTMAQAKAMRQNPVKEAQDIKAYLRYKF